MLGCDTIRPQCDTSTIGRRKGHQDAVDRVLWPEVFDPVAAGVIFD